MKPERVHVISFSPTHTSEQIAKAIVQGMNSSNIKWIDLVHNHQPDMDLPEEDLAIFAVPVYGGRVAPLAMERLVHIKGNNTPAVIMVIYGNRAYEKALNELDVYAVSHGFKVIGGGTFIGEHSYSNENYPIAAGRPHEKDISFAVDFGKKLSAKVNAAADIDHLYAVNVEHIQRPKQPFFPLLRFLRGVLKMRKSGVPAPKVPFTDKELCIHCGQCVEACPNDAIPDTNELITIPSKCIKCCACVKVCPVSARQYKTPYAALLAKNFQKQKEPQVLL